MSEPTLNRRDLNRLALAALGGLASGVLAGCGSNPEKDKTPVEELGPGGTPRLLQDPHICRGINTCKNKGKQGTTNDCAGQGHCATAKAIGCNGTNDCKGLGGCGEHPGENACKQKGACQVPLKPKTWKIARARFEELMKKTYPDKKIGDAPDS